MAMSAATTHHAPAMDCNLSRIWEFCGAFPSRFGESFAVIPGLMVESMIQKLPQLG
jgi:hypothetical protein